MVFGLMRESTHKEIVAKLEARIDYLETKAYGLQTLADAQRSKLDKLTEQVTNTPAPTVTISEPKPAAVAAPVVEGVAKVLTQNQIERHANHRITVLREALPKAEFQVKANSIRVKFNGGMRRIRLSKATIQTNTGAKRFSFLNVDQGDICVTVNDDNTLRSVFVAKKEMCSKSRNIYVFQDSTQDLSFIQNTSLVLRNFK